MVYDSIQRNSKNRKILHLTILTIIAFTCFMFYLSIAGSFILSPFHEFTSSLPHSDINNISSIIFWNIRLPRGICCILIGGILGSVGTIYQNIFRNPLADPYILGVSSGSAVGISISFLASKYMIYHHTFLPLHSILFGCLTLGFVFLLSKKTQSITNLLLSGVVLASFQSAIFSILLILAGQDLGTIFRLMVGNISNCTWEHVYLLLGVSLLGMPIIYKYAYPLNLIAISDESAVNAGVNIRFVRNLLLITGTIMTAAAIGSVGILGFIGLVSPHITTKVLGPDAKLGSMGSFLVGGILLITADLGAIKLIPDMELPVGIITSLVGAPILLLLIKRTDHSSHHS